MGLNIKNEQTHELVRRLAALTGTSQTEAVTDAVRRRLEQVQNDDRRTNRTERILRLGAEIREMTPDQDWTTDDLYDDETGLPR